MAQTLILLLVLATSTLLTACSLDPILENPQDALIYPPGKVHPNYRDSIQILLQQKIADSVVLFYRWQTDRAKTTETFCVASAFITYGSSGWRVQSGGYFVGDTVSQPACNLAPPIKLKASYYYAGETSPLTIIYGLSSIDIGKKVRIIWSDGSMSYAQLQNAAFLTTRPGILQMDRIELIDDDGDVLAQEDF